MALSQHLAGLCAVSAPLARVAAPRRSSRAAPLRCSASKKPSSKASSAPEPSIPQPAQPSNLPARRNDTRVLRSQLAALSQDLMAYEPQSLPVDSPSAPLIPVVFRVQYNTRLGQEIQLVGSSPHLGEWSVANACTLRWTDGGVWTATVSLPAGGIFFYKFFMREDGYLKEWQAGNNVMLVMPNSAADLAGGAVVAESSWTGAPTGLTLQSEARIMQRLQAAETITRQAEAAAQAAGLVAQSVMGELIIAREEAAVALRFIKERGLEHEFEGLVDADGMRRLNEAMGFVQPAGAGAQQTPPAPATPPRKSARKGPATPGAPSPLLSDAEIDRQINDTLAAQLSGALDLSDAGGLPSAAAGNGRVDLSGGDGVWEAAPRTSSAATAAKAGGAMDVMLGTEAAEAGASDPRTMSR